MTSYPDQVAGLIAGLDKARHYPGILFREPTVQTVADTLTGFHTGISAWLPDAGGIRWAILSERGWPRSGYDPSHHMLERGMTTAEVIDELLVVEIETLRRIAAG
jgi:hypothetical protein